MIFRERVTTKVQRLNLPPDNPDELYAWFEQMRADQPVLDLGPFGWHVFGHAEAAAVFANPSQFSSDFDALVPPNPDFELFNRGNFVGMDPPKHQQLRRIVSQAFTPRLIAGLEPRVVELTHKMLDERDHSDSIELVSELAYPLPVTVIAEMLGLPIQDWERFRFWSDTLLDIFAEVSIGNIDDAYQDGAGPILREISEYMLGFIRQRRKKPTDDLISRLTEAAVDDVGLTDEEIIGFVAALLLAGHITSTVLLGNTILCLDESPDQLQLVRSNRSLVGSAIEEVLRYRTPFSRIARLTKDDVHFFGCDIPAQKPVTVWIASANRDHTVFENPDAFDVTRAQGHLGFGYGIHFCIGAALGRMEGRVLLDVILDKFDDFRVIREGLELHDPRALQGPKSLPLVLKPS